jgi:hypothetical protein
MGRSKGNSLERETAKAFSKWIYDEPSALRRTPLSGGWSSAKAGDIILDHEKEGNGYYRPPIYVECRSYKDVLQHDLLKWSYTGSPKIYTQWIREVEQKCNNKLPFLVIKGNGTEPWILLLERWMPAGFEMIRELRRAAIVRINPSRKQIAEFGPVLIFPMKYLTKLGDGRFFLRKWRENGGSDAVRRFGGNSYCPKKQKD